MHWCEGIRCPGSTVTDSYKLQFEYWELNLGALEEWSVFLTAEP